MLPKILCALLALALLANSNHAAPAKPAIAAKSNIDARAVAALDRAVEFYKKQRSFSFEATEWMYLDGESPRRARYEVSLQAPYRASLQAMALDSRGQTQRQISSRLINQESYYASERGQEARVQRLEPTLEARKKALVQLFRILPGAGVSLLSLAMGDNPARTSLVQSVRYGEVLDGKRTLKAVTFIIEKPTRLSVELALSPQTLAVERAVIRGISGGQKLTSITRFGAVRANWKGSQMKTDDAVYNWRKLPLNVPFEIIEPKAQAVLKRASALYAGLNSLDLGWETTRGSYEKIGATETFASSLKFDRAEQKMRLENGDPNGETLLWSVEDGLRMDVKDNGIEEGRKSVTVEMQSVKDKSVAEIFASLENLPSLAPDISQWLTGKNVTDQRDDEMTLRAYGLTGFRIVLLAPQIFEGELCDLVRQSSLSEYIIGEGPNHAFHTIFWFARSDGRLLRIQDAGQFEGAGINLHGENRVTRQIFNPRFAPDAFKWTPPINAILSK